MAQEARKFEPVEIPEPVEQSPAEKAAAAFAASAIHLGLKTLSQKAITATKDIFTLLSAGSVFWLWWSIPDPKLTQIFALGLYALFILVANVIVRRI